MLDRESLIDLRSDAECLSGDASEISGVSVDPAHSLPLRAESFFRQMKNPYLFRSGKLTVNVEFAGGKSLSEALADALRSA